MASSFISLIFSALGIKASNMQHKATLAKKRHDLRQACCKGYDYPLEYYMMCYYNKNSDEIAKKYREKIPGLDYIQSLKMAEFDLLGENTIYKPQIIFARRLMWFMGWLPSNMKTMSTDDQKRKYARDECIRSESEFVFPFGDREPNIPRLVQLMNMFRHSDGFRFNTWYYIGLIQNTDSAVKYLDRRTKEAITAYEDSKKAPICDMIEALGSYESYDIADIVSAIEEYRDEQQRSYDYLSAELQQTDRAARQKENIGRLDEAASVLKAVSDESSDEEKDEAVKNALAALSAIE